MIGAITAWSGSIASIPAGWALCNGSNGTPDLRDRFVIGVGTSHALNSTGGSDTVALATTQIPSHTHDSGGGSTGSSANHTHTLTPQRGGIFGSGASSFASQYTGWTVISGLVTQNTGATANHNHSISGSLGNTGSGSAHENRPPYYALAFIMAVS